MAFNSNITPGAPPLMWSEVYEAFNRVNENFEILVATIGDGSGLTPLNFSSLGSDIIPTTDNLYHLGDGTHRWKTIHAAGYIADTPDAENGVWVGSAQIKGIGAHVDIPLGSTIGGSLLIDPDKTFFKTIDVDNGNSVVATGFGDTVNFLSGDGISMSVDSASESITFENTGILSVSNGDGISVATVSGVATITNSGVRSLTSTTTLPSGRTAGSGINIDNSTGDGIKITNTGVISISNGVGITVSTDTATGDVTITNSAPAVNAFTQIEVNGDSANRLLADAVSDVLNINSGEGITLDKTTGTDTLTITIDPIFDLKGSVFGDDSSILVDAVGSQIVGNINTNQLRTSEIGIALGYQASTSGGGYGVAIGANANAGGKSVSAGIYGDNPLYINQNNQGAFSVSIGYLTGASNQGNESIAIGNLAAFANQGNYAVAIGSQAGSGTQGDYAVAIGAGAGQTSQPANSIVINASATALDGSAAGLFIAPIRSTANGAPLIYDASTKELTYSSALTFTGSIIDTSDSSGITVVVQTTFNTDVVVENDLSVAQQLQVQGSRVINIAELKSLVAASTDFANFQARIAALV